MRITPQLAFAIRLFELASDLLKCALLLAIPTALIMGIMWINAHWGLGFALCAGVALLAFVLWLFGVFGPDEKPSETLQEIRRRNKEDPS